MAVLKRRHISPEDKARFVMLCMRSKRSVARLCREELVCQSSYYLWRAAFIRGGTDRLRRTGRRTQRPKKQCKRPTAKDADRIQFLRRVRVFQNPIVQRCESLQEKSELIDLIEGSGLSKKEGAALAGIARGTFYRWRQRLREYGSIASERSQTERIRVADRQDMREAVFKLLHSPPSDHGFNRTTWKANDLQSALARSGVALGRHAIRAIIKSAGYRWLKARKVLTSRDPEYRTKLDHIQAILGGLGKDEGFFSIDEYGPFAVKCRQGLRLVAPGETATVPQWQKSKGALIVTAALELSTNQVTHFYSKKKDTEEMIKLLEVLLEQHPHLKRMYLSWDAASWHISKRLLERIRSNNVMAEVTGSTRVEIAPLPAGAQFLNVIESVFSGMARAVIHNSDYQSLGSAKAAIDRYFLERNDAFRKHPERAGKRIWGKERNRAAFHEANNCKDPAYC